MLGANQFGVAYPAQAVISIHINVSFSITQSKSVRLRRSITLVPISPIIQGKVLRFAKSAHLISGSSIQIQVPSNIALSKDIRLLGRIVQSPVARFNLSVQQINRTIQLQGHIVSPTSTSLTKQVASLLTSAAQVSIVKRFSPFASRKSVAKVYTTDRFESRD